MSTKIRVAILDDHQSIIDGYLFRLNPAPDIEVVATAMFGDEIEALLKRHPVDVLLLDIQVPVSPENLNPYPVLELIPRLLQSHADMAVLVITMHCQSALVRGVVEAGCSGYILKEDRASVENLAAIIRSVHNGGVYFSQKAHQAFVRRFPARPELTQRQLEALSLCAAYPDAKTAELAKKMSVSHSTMRNLLSDAYLRLGVSNKTAAVLKARQLGLIIPEEPRYDGGP